LPTAAVDSIRHDRGARGRECVDSVENGQVIGKLAPTLEEAAVFLRHIVVFVLFLGFMAALLFWPAGTFDWPGAWVFLAEMGIASMAISLWLLRYDPGLLRERMRLPFQKEQVAGDKIFMAAVQIAWCGWVALMALDAKRWHLSQVPAWLSGVGGVLIALGLVIVWLIFRVNSFAAPVVKIQKERGHSIVTAGPYRIVRHPMYAGAALYMIGMPLLLGSWCGLAIAPLLLAGLSTRIRIEERTLRGEFPDYEDYAARVRYRLIPYVW
jgi:protein-S-isoprenylcysteine O-methyltransferase Ste14